MLNVAVERTAIMLNVAHQIGFYRSFVDYSSNISLIAPEPSARKTTDDLDLFLNREHYKV
jgi:hypothetical protein